MSPTHGPLPVPRDQPGGGGAGWEPPRQTPSLRARSGAGALAAPPLRTDDALSGQRPRPLRGRLSVPSKTPASTVAAAAPRCGPSAACGRGAGPRPRSLSSAASFLHRPWGSSQTPRLAPRPLPRVPALPLGLRRRCSAYSSVRTPGAAVHLGRRRLPEGAFALAGHPQVFAAVRGFLCGAEDEGGR